MIDEQPTTTLTFRRHQNSSDSYTTVRLVSASPRTPSASLSPDCQRSPPSDVLDRETHILPPDPRTDRFERDSMVSPDMEWDKWVDDYSKGHFPSSEPPEKPKALAQRHSDETVTGLHSTSDNAEGRSSSRIAEAVDSTATSSSRDPTSSPAPNVDASPRPAARPRPAPSARAPHHPPESAGEIFDFYQDNGYLPAPKGQFEAERLRTIKRYGLDKPERKSAIDRICRIAKAHFKTNTVIITL